MAAAGEVSGAQIAARLAAIAPKLRLMTPRLVLRCLLEKLGFTLEASFREHTQLAGEWVDERVYGLLAREWR